MNLKKRMSALLGRTDLHDAPAALPRISRLNKAALAFLAAATAAFFVGAPGNAVFKLRTIEITQMTVSATDTFEGESHTTTASLVTRPGKNLDNRAVRVEWTVEADGDNDPEHKWTDNNPGSSSDFTFTYDDLGSTTGAAVVVKAVAFDAEGDSDTDQTTINVWKKSANVNIVAQSDDHDLVDGPTSSVFVLTDVGFWKVKWSVDGSSLPADEGPSIISLIEYDISSVPHGKTVTFTATPYGVNANGEEVAGASATIKITVWKSIGAMLYVPEKCVEGESIDIGLATNVPFDWIEYTFEGDENKKTVNGDGTSDKWSETNYTFTDGGDKDGNTRTVTAVAAYIIPSSGRVVKSPPETQSVKLYADNGFSWTSTVARIHEIEKVEGHTYRLTTRHIMKYYNDNQDSTSFNRSSAWFKQDGADKVEAENEKAVDIEKKFKGSVQREIENDRTLEENSSYAVQAHTSIGAKNGPVTRRSPVDGFVRYNPDLNDPLPIETGVEKVNNNVPIDLE